MRVVGGLFLSTLGAPVTCFTPPAFGGWKASRWPLQPLTSAADVHPRLAFPTRMTTCRRTWRPTAIAPRTRKAQVRLRSSALDEAPADSTAATTRGPSFGDGSAASTAPEDGRPPGGIAVNGIERNVQSMPPVVAATSSATSSLLPLALLNAVTLLWGTQHAVIKLVLQEDLSPGVTNFARFGIAALLFSPWTPGVLRDPPPIPFSPAADYDDVSEAAALIASEKDFDGDGGG
ncbi:unnamed protein product, partial [Laminaria digitata]